MIPRFKPSFNLEEASSILQNKNGIIEKFEKQFAKKLDFKYAVSFPSARSALYSLFQSLNISETEVILPAYDCVVVPAAVISSGNNPRFVDISIKDFNIEPENIAKSLSKKTRAIVPTHMYGNPLDIKKIREIVGEDKYIFEDAAQAILTKDVGKYSDAVFYSMNFEKQIFTFGGGTISTNNEETFEKILEYRKQIFNSKSFMNEIRKQFLLFATPLIFSDTFFRITCTYWNIRTQSYWKKNKWSFNDEKLPLKEIYLSPDFIDNFSKIQATVGLCQINKIEKFIESRKKIARYYDSNLIETKNFKKLLFSDNSSYDHYTILVEKRDYLERYAIKKGIQINKVFDYSLAHLPCFKKYTDNTEKYNNSLLASKKAINLPVYPDLINHKNKLEKIVNCINEF